MSSSRPQRRYAAVPQSSISTPSNYRTRKPVPSAPSSQNSHTTQHTTQTYSRDHSQTHLQQNQHNQQRGEMARNVATGAIGAGYGPYSYNPRSNNPTGHQNRFSNTPSEVSLETAPAHPIINTTSVPPYLWDTKDPDLDDALHNPDPIRDAKLDRSFTLFSSRGWANVGAIIILVGGLLTLFAGYPIISYYRLVNSKPPEGLNTVNSTGQITKLPNFPYPIDKDTPESAMTYTGTDGKGYSLVFSDEFNTDGRTFWPGDDPYWQGVDLHYWPTGDVEWYDPGQITTKDGKLVITMEEKKYHDLNFVSGMLQSWNQMCFTTGYIEVSVSLPGTPRAPGFWPGVWTMGNLGRAGYGATTEGTWPYSYDTCDSGTFPDQVDHSGNPAIAATGGISGNILSQMPGQKLSACTCPGSDHPGPNVGAGRNVPEVDIIEAEVDVSRFQGQVSQSWQTAPFNYQYQIVNTTPATTIYDSSLTLFNTYKGGPLQQAVSAVTYIDDINYNNTGYASYGYEMWSDPKNRDDGYITWFSQGKPSWKVTSASLGPDSVSQVSQRLISEEPMYIILNFGMAPSFQKQDYMHLQFPAQMYIDYVRVYQRDDSPGTGCDPADHPTADYIANHPEAYTNANWTTWDQAGYKFPRNSMWDGC